MADDDFPTRTFATAKAWDTWLAKNHAKAKGLWIKIAKKSSGIATVTLPEALDTALCYGWIDGLRKRFDDDWFIQRYTPRTAKSGWSQINCAKAESLIEQGRMQPAGLRAIEQAKADGRWDAAYASPSKMQVPDDLQRALDNDTRAREFFSTLDSTNRYAILYRLHNAKRPETRARRLAQFMDLLHAHEKIHP